MESAQQTEGETLFQQASQSRQPDVLVKRRFEQRSQSQKSKLANEFIASAGREGISQLAATPDGQHALAVVYDHAGSDGRGTMRQVHEEQGNTAVDYSQKENGEVVAKQSPLGAMPQNQNHLSGAQSSPASPGITRSTSAHNEESLSSNHKELVQQYASVIKKLVVNHENRVKENGVGNTIYRDIVNTLHSLAGSPMRVNESGQYRSSIQKPTTEKEEFHQLRETGVVLELLMNEPEAQAIFKKEFGEAWDKVADWDAQEWAPFIAEAAVVVGAAVVGKKAINTFNISDGINPKTNNSRNNNELGVEGDGGPALESTLEGSKQAKSTTSGGRPIDEPESVRSSEGVSSRPVDDPNSDGTMRTGADAPDKFLPPGNKAFLARSELDTLEHLSSERIALGLTSSSSLRKNLAVAEFNINGETGVLRALSKEPKPGRLDENLVEIPDSSNRVFTTSVVDDIDRAFDSEVKILETIAVKYDPATAKGTINLSSELWNCGSCQGVIKQFSERFKGIEINSQAGPFQTKMLQKQANIPLLYKGQ
jgi:hypothetical protein